MNFPVRQYLIHVPLALVVLLLLPLEAASQPPRPQPTPAELKTLTLEELGEVEVTTTNKQPETVWQTAAAVYVITQNDIRRSGATTLPDILRLAPGISVSQSDSNRWAVGVRGFADLFSKSVLVLIDGRSIYTPLVGGVHWAIQDVPLAEIEQIEVIRGAGGTVWGANAVNGVINIVTKDTAATRGTAGVLAAGNVEEGRVWVRHGGAIAENADYRVYVKGITRDAQFHADGTTFDRWRSMQTGFRTDWNLTTRGMVTISGDVYRTRAGERAEASFFSPPSSRTVDDDIDLTGGNVILRWDRRFTGGAASRLQVYYDYTRRDGFTFGERRNTVDLDFNMRHTAVGRHEVSWGAGARVSPSTITQTIPTLNFAPHSLTGTLAGGFLQDQIHLVPQRLSLTVGAKLEHNNYTGAEVLPSARMLWTAQSQSLWGSVTRAVRTPSRFERDLQFQALLDPASATYLAINGSSNFQSESVVASEIGYRRLLAPSLYLDVAAFVNDYDGLAGLADPIATVESAPVRHVRLTLPFANAVDGTSRGFEVSPDWKPASWWQLKGSYSRLRITAENRAGFTNPAFRDNYLGLSPRHQVRIQSRVDLPRGVELDQSYRYVGGLPAHKIREYHTVDARVGWRISNQVTLSAVGQNLLQPHHAEFAAVPVEIRRSAYVQLLLSR